MTVYKVRFSLSKRFPLLKKKTHKIPVSCGLQNTTSWSALATKWKANLLPAPSRLSLNHRNGSDTGIPTYVTKQLQELLRADLDLYITKLNKCFELEGDSDASDNENDDNNT